MRVRVELAGQDGVWPASGHSLLDVEVAGRAVLAQTACVGRARWGSDRSWDAALEAIPRTLGYLAAWSTAAMRCAEVRVWTSTGEKRCLRQLILDHAIWWRAVSYTLAGHAAGLVIARPPARRAAKDALTAALDLLPAQQDPSAALSQDEREALRESAGESFFAKIHADRVQRYLQLCEASPGDAEAFLSSLLKPKAPTQIAIRDPRTGERWSLRQTVQALQHDVATRGQAAEPENPTMGKAVRATVREARCQAQMATIAEPEDPFTIEQVATAARRINPHRASARLPREAVRSRVPLAERLTWALLCLISVVGLVPALWHRVIKPIRKRGPRLVTQLECLRPVRYVDNLEGLFALLWLDEAQHVLNSYTGQLQAGGKYDAVLVVIAIVAVIQARLPDPPGEGRLAPWFRPRLA